MNRRARVAGLAFLTAAAACATSKTPDKVESPKACDRGLCAKVVDRELTNTITIELEAPANASLQNAYVAEPGIEPCRGGRTLNATKTDAGVRMSGPLPLAGVSRLTMSFTLRFTSGSALDLDVRSPEGAICLRVPIAGTPPDGGHG